MDPYIAGQYHYVLRTGLRAIPTISLVTVLDNLFDPDYGIYVNARAGDDDDDDDDDDNGIGGWERPASVEFFVQHTYDDDDDDDDDTTQSAVRFLIRLDKILEFREEQIHKAVTYALDSTLTAQFPNGGWYQWWDRYPSPTSPNQYPVMAASYPKSWSRKWLNDWTGVYFINDELVPNMIMTMFTAYDTYGEDRYLASAEKAAEFLLLAQMPDPQPAWAQQYDRNMHPVWDRKFEPPAITGRESQTVLEALLLLYRRTGNKNYLDPVPRAISYFNRSRLADGRLARFYELKTNHPLYFKRTGKRYDLTYSSNDLPTHYAFIIDSRLDSIKAEYRRLLKTGPASLNAQETEKTQRLSPTLKAQARNVISSMDERGAWVERGRLRHHKVEPESGIIDCRTFVNNVRTLCGFLTVRK